MLTGMELFITILAIALATVLTRFIPFMIFPPDKSVPPIIIRLGNALAPAMMGLLMVYCLKALPTMPIGETFTQGIALIGIAIIHYFKRNALLSILVGTIIYLVLNNNLI